MQVLFQMEINKDDSMEAVELFCKHFKVSRKLRPFLLKLVQGVKQYQAEIDGLIDAFSDKWKISRMCGVDRNLLRLAVYELLYCDDIPAKVTINEAIEIAKRFGTENSGAFINGILDSIRISLKEEKARDENRVYE